MGHTDLETKQPHNRAHTAGTAALSLIFRTQSVHVGTAVMGKTVVNHALC